MTDMSPHLNILLLVSPQKALDPPRPSRMRANAPELPRPTESSERAISTETNVDGGTVTGSWGKSLGWAAPEGQGPITYGHAMPRAERPRQWGEDFGEASPPGLALRERQVVGPESPGFSPPLIEFYFKNIKKVKGTLPFVIIKVKL
nr:uncharacterized protein LOC113820104 [Penaeus vannamei]